MSIKRHELIRASLIDRWQTYVAHRRRSVVLLDVIGPAVLAEVAGPSLLVVVIGLFVLFLGIPLIEAVVYLALKWGDFKRSYKDAFLVNLITTIVGFILIAVQPSLSRGNALNTPSGFLMVAFVLSVLIEGAVLLRLKRHPARQTWLVAIASNVVSYALLLVFVNL
jgi:hypothetical protein